MQSKLQELTEKIYQEGVEKGNAEAEVIISNAKKEAESIVTEAKKQAENLIKEAKKKSDEILSNGESELKLSSKQAVNALKQKITDLINGSIINATVSTAFDDKSFIQKVIETTVKNWNSATKESPEVTVLVPKSDEKSLLEYFTKSAKNLLDKGLEIKGDESIKSGFQISPKDGSFKIGFTGDDFANFFKQYLRPRLVELLFEDR
jgi:V/A-type H+-transporting ATPase subunit E